MAKYCTNCGAPIEEGMVTCMSCGAYIYDEANPVEKEDAQVFEEMKEETTQSSGASTSTESSTSSNGTIFCSRCGKPVNKDAVICIHCGCSVQGNVKVGQQDSSNIGWGFLGFFASFLLTPIIGLVLWLMWKDETPIRAKNIGIGTLVAVILGVVGGIIGTIVYIVAFIPMMAIATTPLTAIGALLPMLGL